jgi:uncharacterized protein (DUF58 family)
VISRSVLRGLRIERVLPESATVGEPVAISYRFANSKRYWPSLSVGLAELDGNEAFTRQPHSYMLHAAPGMHADVPTAVVPKRRGVHQLNRYQLSTSFPFGFIKRAIDGAKRDRLLVYPPLAEVDQKLLALCRSAEKTGAVMRPKRGGADEFYGVKEYRAGDNPRWIYWRRSARTGVLVSKEMTQVAPPRLLLLVDTYLRLRTPQEHAAVERTVAMAASLASAAMESGISVGLIAWDDRWVELPPNRGKRHRRDILTALAMLPLNESHDTEALLESCRGALTAGTTPVLITPREIQMGMSEARQASMVVICSTSPTYERWFRFPKEVDFSRCMPVEQQPEPAK